MKIFGRGLNSLGVFLFICSFCRLKSALFCNEIHLFYQKYVHLVRKIAPNFVVVVLCTVTPWLHVK